jgi:hypothetical protein
MSRCGLYGWRASVLAALLLAGCSEAKLEVPQTYPASGTLLDKAGKPIAEAHVRLSPASGADNQLIISGISDTDGTFTLETQHMNDAARKGVRDGVPAGDYRVTIIPNSQYDQRKGPPPVATWRPQTVKIDPQENTLKFEVVISSPR